MAEGHDTLTTVAPPAFKKRHRGCSFCILDIENAPLPTFPPNELVVGVITMEDVIEELLQVGHLNALNGFLLYVNIIYMHVFKMSFLIIRI